MDRWASIASFAPSIANLPFRLYGANKLLKTVLGVAPERELPHFAARNFRDAFRRSQPSSEPANGEDVLLWPDTWNNYFQPQNLHAAAKVLRAAGHKVQVPKRHICCGRPLYDFGFLDEARNICLGYSRSSLPRSMPVYPW